LVIKTLDLDPQFHADLKRWIRIRTETNADPKYRKFFPKGSNFQKNIKLSITEEANKTLSVVFPP
jgi:hypothetical protein